MKHRANDRQSTVAGTRARRAFVAVALALALLPTPAFDRVVLPDRGTLAQEEPTAASPGAELLTEAAPSPTATPTAEPTATPAPEPADTSVPPETPIVETPTEPAPSVPTETPPPMATATPSPTGTATPAGRSTAVPSGTVAAANAQASEPKAAASSGGETDISPNRSDRAAPGATVSYVHTVTNKDHRSADYKNITASSSHGWTVELLDANGVKPLIDHNGDGIPDTGRLGRKEGTRIVVRVTLPADAPAGVKDKTTVMAASALSSSRTSRDTATDTTTVTRVLTLEMGATEVDFGQIAADGRLDGAAPGVTSEVDDRGAYYVKEQAILVVVTANVPWTGSCAAAENRGTATGITIAGGRLQWRLNGTTNWTPFPSTRARASDVCFPHRALGTNSYVYDVRVRVERTDAAGTFRSTLRFTANP
jgi:hypothetical protein